MTGRFARALAAVACAVTAVLAAAPLTNEDVVKMVLEHDPVDAIVETIESSAVAFDLSPDMIDELRRAGVPQAVLDAMAARSAPPGAPDPARPGIPTGRVRVTVTLRSPGRWSAPAGSADLAVFLACATARHAPSPWRAATPLGEDFAMPRHEMLAFIAGARRVGERLTLDLPPSLSADLIPDEVHDLIFGLATRKGAQWSSVATVRLSGLGVSEEGAMLDASIEPAEDRPETPPRLTLRPASTPASTPPPPPS